MYWPDTRLLRTEWKPVQLTRLEYSEEIEEVIDQFKGKVIGVYEKKEEKEVYSPT